jgi:hypothetical protein
VVKAAERTCPSPLAAGVFCDARGMRYTLGKVELNGSHVSTVNAPITAGQVQISGNYTKQDAEALAEKITG